MNHAKIITHFKNQRILIIGDLMLDRYVWGRVSRISPEAPVQVVNVLKESHSPGGAANVAVLAPLMSAMLADTFLETVVPPNFKVPPDSTSSSPPEAMTNLSPP